METLNETRKETASMVVKELLGGGEGAGSKLSGLGIMLAAIWMILEWQGGAIRSEIDAVRAQIADNRVRIVEETQLRRERMQMEIEESIGSIHHELADMSAFSNKERSECHDRIERITKTDESLQKQIIDLRQMVKAMRQIEAEHKSKDSD